LKIHRTVGQVYAPSTLGSFLRAFTHGHVRQLESAARQVLTGLAKVTPLLPAAAALTFIDIDSLLRPVYGKAKEGASFGHAKVGGYQIRRRGYSPLVATISTPQAAPVIAATRLAGRQGRLVARGGEHGRRGDRHRPCPRGQRGDHRTRSCGLLRR
jgi:hypothetical protein